MVESSCEDIKSLETLVKRIIPIKHDSVLHRVWKALRSMRAEKQVETAAQGIEKYKTTLSIYMQRHQCQAIPAAQAVLNTAAARIRDQFFNCCKPKDNPGLRATRVGSEDFAKVRDALIFRPYI